jgi:16S rRNA (cytosine967-C5)-methyltransferase
MIARARVAAFDIVKTVAAGRHDLPAAIARSRRALDDDRDKALAAEIATGVERWRASLDYLIEAASARRIDRLDPEIAAILRLSAYQLLHLTRVPAAAVVDDAVELTRKAKKRSASGFVNAVLRTLSRQRAALSLPPRPADAADRAAALDYLSITLSHPRWLVSRWLDRFGFADTERWLQFNNTHARLTLRANRLRIAREALADRLAAHEISVSPGRFAPDALIVESGQPLGLAPGLIDDGSFVVQDEASQIVSLLVDARAGDRILDCCASPGGKTTAIAAAMSDRGLIVAADVRQRRIDLLRRTVTSSGATTVRIVQADAAAPLPFSSPFGRVLLDAPCSGLGTLRRDPDIRWRRREEDLAILAAAQSQMLGHAAACVAPGGRLVYATCSSEPEENERVVDDFLASTDSFALVDARTIAGVAADVVDPRGCLRTLPHRHGLEAFFGAVLQRSAGAAGSTKTV